MICYGVLEALEVEVVVVVVGVVSERLFALEEVVVVEVEACVCWFWHAWLWVLVIGWHWLCFCVFCVSHASAQSSSHVSALHRINGKAKYEMVLEGLRWQEITHYMSCLV